MSLRTLSQRAERIARIAFAILSLIVMVAFAILGRHPYGITNAVMSSCLAYVLYRHLRPACRLSEPTGALNAEIVSVSAALCLMASSAVIRRNTGVPLGIVDALAGIAALYFVWRLIFASRHLGQGTLPPKPETGLEFARRAFSDAWEFGSSLRKRK